MLLIELATQAVQGFSPTSRSALRPGYNVLVPPAGSAPRVAALVATLLYGDGGPSEAGFGTGQSAARAALSFQANDGATWRLVRNLAGALALQRLEPGSNAWTLVTQDIVEAGQRLRELLRLPSRAQFEELFCIGPQELPSRRGGDARAATLSGTHPAVSTSPTALRPTALVEAAMASARARLDPAALAARIDELRSEVEVGRGMEAQQFKLEGLHRRIFELEEQLKRVDALIADVGRARQASQGGHTADSLSLPPDALEHAARYDEAQRRRDEALTKLRMEFAELNEQAAAARPQPLWRERALWAGSAAGLAALAVGWAFHGTPAGYLALLDVPAFGFAGMAALRWIGGKQREGELQQKLATWQEREEKVHGSFDAEYLPIRAALRVVGLESGRELVEYLRAQEKVRGAVAAAEARLQQARADPTLLSALDEQEQLKAEARQLEAILAEQSVGAMRDWRDAERELHDLECGESGEPAAPGAAPATSGPRAEVVPGKDDPTPRLLSAALEFFGNPSLEALGGMIRDRATQYLVALSDRRFQALELDARGGATLVANGQRAPAGQLEDSDLDLLYLALKLTLTEKQAPLRKLPLVLDEPFIGFDEAKLQLLSRMLKHISTMTQVLHASALPAHLGIADSAGRL